MEKEINKESRLRNRVRITPQPSCPAVFYLLVVCFAVGVYILSGCESLAANIRFSFAFILSTSEPLIMSDSDLGEKTAVGHHEVATERSTGIHEEFATKEVGHGHGHKKTKQELVQEIDARAMAPGVTRESFSHIDEKKLLRKMDMRLLPILTLLYLLSFIDRGNIGNAKIEGLAEDLNLTGGQYNWYV